MNQTEEIKKRIEVVDLISSYMPLKKAGRNFRGVCPFHQEKTPSFMVSPEKQIWYCFGCNQGGDIFSFIQKIEGVDFVESLHLLAERSGVTIEKSSGGTGLVEKGKKATLYDIVQLLEKWYQYYLYNSERGKTALHYLLEDRCLPEDILKKFSVGLVPAQTQTTLAFLHKRNFSNSNELVGSGVFVHSKRGGLYDRFSGRIVFPIHSPQGKAIGFGGRLFDDSAPEHAPKYLNSTQTDIYDKGGVLFGVDLARQSIRTEDRVIVVEGYMDVLASHVAGVENVVATCGTALTRDQLRLLARYTKNIVFCFDSDAAGVRALERVFEVAQGIDISLFAADLQSFKDPDEMIRTQPELWGEVSRHPIPALEYVYRAALEGVDLGSPIGKKNFTQQILPMIASLESEVERSHYLTKLSFDLNVPEKFLLEALGRISKVSSLNTRREENSVAHKGSDEHELKVSREFLLLGIALTDSDRREKIFSLVEEADFPNEKLKTLYKIALDCHNTNIQGGTHGVVLEEAMRKHVDPQAVPTLDLLLLLTRTFFDDSDTYQSGDVDLLIGLFEQHKKQQQRGDIQREIMSLDKAKDREKVKEMLKKLQDLI